MGTYYQHGSISGYLAKPSGNGPWPALIVIQEWWGLDLQTQSIADRFAAIGYFAFAPDLYHGELAKLGDGQKAAALVQKYAPGAPADLEKVYDAIKGLPECNGKVGSVGFCFGGRMSLALGISRPWMQSAPSTVAGCNSCLTNLAVSRVPYWVCSVIKICPFL